MTRTADFLPGFVHKEPNFAPGEGCRYCNVGYVLAGLALESVTGTPYREHVREHVLARAGMDRSGFFRMDEAEPDVAEGWEPVHEDRTTRAPSPGGGRTSTPTRPSARPTAARTPRRATSPGSGRRCVPASSCRPT